MHCNHLYKLRIACKSLSELNWNSLQKGPEYLQKQIFLYKYCFSLKIEWSYTGNILIDFIKQFVGFNLTIHHDEITIPSDCHFLPDDFNYFETSFLRDSISFPI